MLDAKPYTVTEYLKHGKPVLPALPKHLQTDEEFLQMFPMIGSLQDAHHLRMSILGFNNLYKTFEAPENAGIKLQAIATAGKGIVLNASMRRSFNQSR